MTNEQLAALAQQPENEELVPLLWEKVKPLLWLKAKQAYNARQSAPSSAAWNYGTFGKAAIRRF